jgi:hypothetical protein
MKFQHPMHRLRFFLAQRAWFLLSLCAAGTSAARVAERTPIREPIIVLPRAVRDSMGTLFTENNRHWNELADLNTLERMLAGTRPTQREYLGCLQGSVRGDTVRVESWQPARNMKQLPMAVTGDCEGIERLLGTWHTHPYRPDLRNQAIKERRLSAQDLATFGESSLAAAIVLWDADSLDAAARAGDGSVRHPVQVLQP